METISPLLLRRFIQWSGIASLFFYAAVVLIVNTTQPTSTWFSVIPALLGAAYGLYVLLWFVTRTVSWDAVTRRWVFGFGVALVLVGACVVPPAKTDIYHYIAEDRAWVLHHQNPFTTPVRDITNDSTVYLSHWQNLATQHGPLRLFITAPGSWLDHGSLPFALAWYRLVLLVCVALSSFLIYRLVLTSRPEWATAVTVLWLWNPLIIFEVFYNGGTDLIMMTFFLGSLYALTRQRFIVAAGLFIASVLVKYITILALPFFLIHIYKTAGNKRAGIIRCVGALGVMAGITVIAYAPFWSGFRIFDSLLWVASVVESNSLAGFIAALGLAAFPGFPVGFIATLSIGIFVLGYGALCLHALVSSHLARNTAARYDSATFGLFLLFGKTWFYPKYSLWLVPLLLLDSVWAPVAVVASGLAVTSAFDVGFMTTALAVPAIVWATGFYLYHTYSAS